VIDPYAMLGLERDADENAVKAAYRKAAKGMHPDSGGDADQFARLQTCYDLLRDPVRRKVFDDTGFDPQLADPRDLKGLMLLERRKLSDDIVKSRFHILELERHRNRVRQHIDRLGRKAGTDFLGSMLRARSQSIAEAIRNAEAQIQSIEQAYAMLEGYSYELAAALEPVPLDVKGEAAE
jgi:curved DNA-binding protein CbpA